jgi:maltose O-acetyltransferase
MNENVKRNIKNTAYYLGLAFANRFVAHLPFFTMRRLFYCPIFRMQIAPGAFIAMGVKVMSPWKIKVGRDAVINTGCLLDGRRGIVIGDNVTISWDACILTLQHDPDDAMFSTVGAPVRIEDYAWIATRAIIMPGVRVGKGAIVGANAVVTKDVDDFTIVAGNPARPIRKRSQDLKYTPRKNLFFDWAV